MEIRLFGSLEVVVDGRTVPVAGQAERSLLAVLACSAGRVVAVDQLIDHLWGEDLPANPSNALQVRVSKLRRQLGDVISAQPAGYRLEGDPDNVDVHRFARLISSRCFKEALALYRGPALSEFSGQEWARAEIARLEELYLAAVEEDVEDRLRQGGDVGLVSELEALVLANPLRERLRGQLMLALHRNGRSADALARYQEGRRLLRDELGLDPSDALQQLEAAILHHETTLQAGAPASRPHSNLPVRLSSFVGREADVGRVLAALEGTRLVTLTGPGGAGKTSLAIEASRSATASYPDGVWFVALAGVTDPSRVVSTIAETLGIADRGGRPPRDLVTAWLSQREALLVLDNCEHVIDTCARLVEHLLGSSSPGARIIATSREALGVPGEAQLPVPPLGEDDAVALFADRAASIDPGFFRGANEDIVRAICLQLDGMPLAIELAAARVNVLPVAEIATRLDDRFRLLTGGARTAAARHRTLRATIDWSYDLLDGPQRVLLRRLAVFRGGWTLEAAEGVCAGGVVPCEDVLDLLTALVERSLVVARDGRFRLLETIRQYAADRLGEAGEDEALRERHARYFLAFVEQAEPELRGLDQSRWLSRLRAEDDNFQLALRWCRERGADQPDLGLRLAAALGWYWYVGRQVDGRRELTAMLAAVSGGSAVARARVLQALSLAMRPAGCIVHPSKEAAAAARQSLALFAGTEDRGREAISRLLLAVEGVGGDDVPGCLREVAAARALLREHGDRWGQALADFVDMEILLRNGADGAALSLGESAAAAFEELGDDWGRSAVPMHLGAGLRLVGRPHDAVKVLNRALSVCYDARLENNLARVCAELGGAAADVGDTDEADRWYAECERVARGLSNDTMLSLAWLGHGTVARLRRDPAHARKRFADALEVTTKAGMAAEAVAALAGLAATCLDAGDLAQAAATLSRASDAARDIGEAGTRASVLEQRARLVLARGDHAEGAGLLAEASALREAAVRPRTALEVRDVGEAASAFARLGQAELMLRHYDKAERWSLQALEVVATPEDDPEAWAMARRVLGGVRSHRGDAEAGVELCQAAVDAAPSAEARALAVAYLGVVLLEAGRYDEAVKVTLDAAAEARPAGVDRSFDGYLGALAAEGLVRLGRWREADTVLAAQVGADTLPVGVIRLARSGAILAARRGEHERALALLAEAGSQPVDPWHRALLDETAAEVHIALTDWAEAAAAAQRGWEATPPTAGLWVARFAMLSAVAEVELTLDALARRDPVDVTATVARLEARIGAARQAGTAATGHGKALPASTSAHLAHAAAAVTQLTAPAPDAWQEAAHHWEHLGDPYATASARLGEAEAAAATGAAARAADALQGAHRLASSLGAVALLAEADVVSRRTRLSLEPPAPVVLGDAAIDRLGLTAREAEVLALVAAGQTNRQIGEALYVSQKTASVHVSNILRKLGVTSRVDAAAAAQRLGIA